MTILNHLGSLPKSLRTMAEIVIDTGGANDPVIVDMTLNELESLAAEEEIVFQLILDRKYKKWYLVAVGDYERIIKSQYLEHNPLHIKRSIMAFCQVDDAWIRSKKAEALRHKMISEHPKEFIEDTHGTRWV